jgi:ligand-binding sensor domain-containing protein
MSENTLVQNDATDADNTQVENQAQATKTYTQEEVDNMMARMRGSLEKKLLKPYQDLGDPDELRSLKSEAERRAQEQQIKRGEFEKTLQELAAKKDSEIQKRDAKIKEYQINTPLLSAAAQYRAVNAEQVKALLANNVRLNQEGEVEVIDTKGAVRYNDAGEPLGVNDLVREFLDSNPHFVQPTPATTNSKSNVTAPQGGKVDISKLDMKNPEHRKLFAEAQRAKA